MEIKGKTIIVTGANSGIGLAAARLFATEGAKVVLGARREKLLAEAAREVDAGQGRAAYLAGDVTEPAYAKALVDLAVETFGTLDGAFNNAGTLGDLGPIAEMTDETWNAVIQTNLTSAFHAARVQIPALRAAGGGSIVFTSSFVGFSNAGLPGMSAYAASKAGLVGLVKSLAADHAAENIRVNALLPGGTKTGMVAGGADALDFIASLHPMKRMASVDEIAQAALFLLSDRSSFVTGSPLLADGGISIRLA